MAADPTERELARLREDNARLRRDLREATEQRAVTGGDINVQSEPGKGTVFSVRLPAEVGAAGAASSVQ